MHLFSIDYQKMSGSLKLFDLYSNLINLGVIDQKYLIFHLSFTKLYQITVNNVINSFFF